MPKKFAEMTEEEAKELFTFSNPYFERGIEIGREQGREEGRKAEREELVQRMITKGLADELIADLSGCSMDEIKEMKKRLK